MQEETSKEGFEGGAGKGTWEQKEEQGQSLGAVGEQKAFRELQVTQFGSSMESRNEARKIQNPQGPAGHERAPGLEPEGAHTGRDRTEVVRRRGLGALLHWPFLSQVLPGEVQV